MRIKQALLALSTIAIIVLTAQVGLAQEPRKPSTPEERAQAVQLTRFLETDPLNKDAKMARKWLLTWLTEVPDITITLCGDYLKPLLEKDKDYSKDIFFQMSFSSAAFMIEHPDQAADDVAVNKAGLEGALRTYEAIVKAKPKVKWPFLDELIQRREKGTLEEYVREISTTKCKETKK
ncbi:MAG TPA: hypothetical protein VF658_02570 [Pyrinomonadaceae bacterium]|jgi:hypothetical protein